MPTPDSPHMANLFVLLVGTLMGWLFLLGLSRVSSAGPGAPHPRLLVMVWGYFWVLVLLVNAAAAASNRTRWAAIATLPAVSSLADLDRAANGAEVVLAGRARSRETPTPSGGAAYLVEYNAEGERSGDTGDLLVDLGGGPGQITGLDRAFRWNWRYERSSRSRYSLAIEDPVVALGTIRHGTSIGGGGATPAWVEAAVVRRGTHAEFATAAEAQSRRPWPRILAWASLLAAIAVALVPLAPRARRSAISKPGRPESS